MWQSVRNRQWYWHLRAGNHEIIAHGEGYTTKDGCINGIQAVANCFGGEQAAEYLHNQ